MAGFKLTVLVSKIFPQIEDQIKQRTYTAANELRNAELEVLRGARSGRVYNGIRASAPGEPPALRSGKLHGSFRSLTFQEGNTHVAAIETGVFYVDFLENGTSKMAKRPINDPVLEKAKPALISIYERPYVIKL